MSNLQTINFTFAVMIFNVKQFLPDCIESVIRQKGDDIEVLLIDDGSTDGSEKICDEYQQKDSRVRVIHQKNAGVAAARNVAIENAKGKWLVQIDGDDILTDHAIDSMREYIDDDSDIIQFDSIPFVSFDDFPTHSLKGDRMIVAGDLLQEYHYQLIDKSNAKIKFPTYNLNPAWSKMWNMAFIHQHGLRYFPEVVKGEGTLFTFNASYYATKVTIDPRPIYGYRINPYSIMRRFSADIMENQDVQFRTYLKVLQKHNEDSNPTMVSALYKRGMYLIENAIYLSISHPDCNWSKDKRVEWLKELVSYDWVQQTASFAQSIDNQNKVYQYISNKKISGLNRYCKYLRFNLSFRKLLKSFGIR